MSGSGVSAGEVRRSALLTLRSDLPVVDQLADGKCEFLGSCSEFLVDRFDPKTRILRDEVYESIGELIEILGGSFRTSATNIILR